MFPTEEMSSSPPTCGGFLSRVTVEEKGQQEELDSKNCTSPRRFSDAFMVADVASMNPKFGWWNVVDGAMLQRFSCSKAQSPIERWFRLEKKAAKVGKGLVKNKKGRKLVSQHWLEAIDPLHRYGHNLRFYFQAWCQSDTEEPFFYWLDSGEGKDLNLGECPKSTLQNERIRYLGPKEREQYEVIVEDGKLLYKQSRGPVNTTKGEKWIFVMSTSGVLYVGKKERGNLQHSSFLAGAAITSAGRLRVEEGIIKSIEAHSGHYRPTPENFKQLILILESRGADLTTAKIQYSSKEMLKPSKSLNVLQTDNNRCKTEDKSSTPTSVSPRHVECAEESSEKEDFVRDLRVSGKHDIYKQERCGDEEKANEDCNRTLGENLVAENGVEQRNGHLPEDEESSILKSAGSCDCANCREMHMNIGRAQLEILESDLKITGVNQVQAEQRETSISAQEPLSVQDEEVVEDEIEEVIAN